MLFKQETLAGLKTGKITVAFRKWNKASVKIGSSIKTAVGIIEVLDIVKVELPEIKLSDALEAGFSSLESLTGNLNKIVSGDIYRISLRYKSEDPRLSLREQTGLTPEQFELLSSKLMRLDQFSRQCAWTVEVLKAIRNNPKLKAGELAIKVDKEKEWLKINIRKLKNLGLTISHEPGYTLSPLGHYYLETIKSTL